MSRIHSCWMLLGDRSLVSCGSARFSTLKSTEINRIGSASTARPSHSRQVAVGAGPTGGISGELVMVIPSLRFARLTNGGAADRHPAGSHFSSSGALDPRDQNLSG